MAVERCASERVGLPPGTVATATDWATAAHQVLGLPTPDDGELARALLLPRQTSDDWPGPGAPQRVGGAANASWVQADVTDDDRDTLDVLRSRLPGAHAETVAATGQEWRLPIVPYRRGLPPPEWRPVRTLLAPTRPLDLSGRLVLDLSSLWAGPWCTRLLARAGADVVKVDPDCRPDGFREHPALYRALNEDKQVIDLDLRERNDRARFDQLVRRADVLVSSFSRRVLPNLGYGADDLRRLNPTLRSLQVVGFSVGPEREWLAYGSGIHAICGLGWSAEHPREAPQAAPVAYPDPLTGYLGVLALGALAAGQSIEVPLAGAGAEVAYRGCGR